MQGTIFGFRKTPKKVNFMLCTFATKTFKHLGRKMVFFNPQRAVLLCDLTAFPFKSFKSYFVEWRGEQKEAEITEKEHKSGQQWQEKGSRGQNVFREREKSLKARKGPFSHWFEGQILKWYEGMLSRAIQFPGQLIKREIITAVQI